MSDAGVETVRRLYAAIAVRDFPTMEKCFTPDAIWHLPGRNAISGAHRGWAAIRDDFLARIGPLSGGTLRVDLLDVTVGEQYVVAVQHATADYEGRRLDVTACQLIRVVGGRIVEVRGHYSDMEAMDAFWQAS